MVESVWGCWTRCVVGIASGVSGGGRLRAGTLRCLAGQSEVARAEPALRTVTQLIPSRWRRKDFCRWMGRASKAWARKRPSSPTWQEILQQLSGVELFDRLDANLLIYIYSLMTPPQLRWDGDENDDGRIFTRVCIRPRGGLLFGCRPQECLFRLRRQQRRGDNLPGVGPIRVFYYYLEARDYAWERADDWPWTQIYLA